MDLYHASPAAGLAVLKPSVTEYFGKPKQVCLTPSRAMALLYGVRHFEYTYGYTREKELYYEEYFPDALEALYRGKSASLYRCAWREGMGTTQIPNEYVSADEVPIEEELPIPDVCGALLEQERLGALRIVRWPEVPEKRRQWIVKAEMETILENGLLERDVPMARYMRETYPESWARAWQSKKESAQ